MCVYHSLCAQCRCDTIIEQAQNKSGWSEESLDAGKVNTQIQTKNNAASHSICEGIEGKCANL